MNAPRVTFGMIVFNGEPFLRYNLRALYPFAHQIIVVEGACPGARRIATEDGHSTDGTREVLRKFKAAEDPQNKLQIVTRDGFWPEKDEQSRAYAERATGSYLWQVDVDEFYQPDQVQKVLNMLQNDPEITAVTFREFRFWGGFDYVVNGWYLNRHAMNIQRLFRWGPNYRYAAHRPPTVVDDRGRDVVQLKPVYGATTEAQGIILYHYPLVFPKQVLDKCEYYAASEWAQRDKAREWAEESFLKLKRPFRVHNVYDYPSWLERFQGRHPPQVELMKQDLRSGKLPVQLRDTADIESLLNSQVYRLQRTLIRHAFPIATPMDRMGSIIKIWWDRLCHPLRTMRNVTRKILGRR